MLSVRVAYENGKRVLSGSIDSIYFVMRWHTNFLTFSWYSPNYWYDAGTGSAHSVQLSLWRERVSWVGTQYYTVFMSGTPRTQSLSDVVPAPEQNWGDLMQIARFVAARKCEKTLLLGWIEDHLPEPWSLLASPDPVECFRRICPVPLSEKRP